MAPCPDLPPSFDDSFICQFLEGSGASQLPSKPSITLSNISASLMKILKNFEKSEKLEFGCFECLEGGSWQIGRLWKDGIRSVGRSVGTFL